MSGGRPGRAGAAVLRDPAPVLRRLGDLQHEAPLRLDLPQHGVEALALVGAQPAQQLAAPHRDEEEDLPEHDPQVRDEVRELGQVRRRLAADGAVDLQRQAELVRPGGGLDRAVEGALGPAERVVEVRAREVEREGDLVEARVLELAEPLVGELLRGRRDRGDPQAARLAVPDQQREVGPVHRVSATEDQERCAHVGDRVDEPQPLVRRQLAGAAAWAAPRPDSGDTTARRPGWSPRSRAAALDRSRGSGRGAGRRAVA